MKNGVERRRDARIPAGWPAFLMTSQGPISGVTEDISMGGILILCSETIETENEIEIVIRLAKDHEMPATVKKIWSDKLLAHDSIYNEIGFSFTKISAGDRQIIASQVAEYYPI